METTLGCLVRATCTEYILGSVIIRQLCALRNGAVWSGTRGSGRRARNSYRNRPGKHKGYSSQTRTNQSEKKELRCNKG